MNAPLRQKPDLRARMEAAVERLLAALDALDAPDEDLEDATEDNDVHDAGGRQVDDEPSLGSLNDRIDQRQWSAGSCEDLEGPEDDVEPSLAGFSGSGDDREADAAEWGIGDGDGLLEQVGFDWGRAE